MTGFYNRDGECFLRGTYWTFTYNSVWVEGNDFCVDWQNCSAWRRMLPFTVQNTCLITLSHKHCVKKYDQKVAMQITVLWCKAVYFRNWHESSACGNTLKGVNEIFHLRTLTIYPVDNLLPAKRHLIQNPIRFPPRCQWDLLSPGMLRSVDRYLTKFRDNLSVPSSRVW
jgi:hypothetical protein